MERLKLNLDRYLVRALHEQHQAWVPDVTLFLGMTSGDSIFILNLDRSLVRALHQQDSFQGDLSD